MNKKTFGLVCLCLLAGAGVGACAGVTIYSQFEKQANIVMVAAEEVSEELTSEELTDDEIDALQDLLDDLNSKYDELRDTQIFGTTIGTLVGALVGAVVSLAPSLLNRSNIKTAIEEVSIAKSIIVETTKLAEQVRKDYAITDDKYNKVIKSMTDISSTLEKTQRAMVKLSSENAEIKAGNKELKEILLMIISQSGVLTALGVSEEAFKKYIEDKVGK